VGCRVQKVKNLLLDKSKSLL